MSQPRLPEEESPVLSTRDILHIITTPPRFPGLSLHSSVVSAAIAPLLVPSQNSLEFSNHEIFFFVPLPHICGFTSFYFSTIIFIKSPEAEKKNTHTSKMPLLKSKNLKIMLMSPFHREVGEGGRWEESVIPHSRKIALPSGVWPCDSPLCMFAECCHRLGLREVQTLPVSLAKLHWKYFLHVLTNSKQCF